MGRFRVEHSADWGSGEPWVARTLLQWQSIIDAIPAFAPTRDEFHLDQGEVFMTLGLAFEALRKLRDFAARPMPGLQVAEAYASLYSHLWQAYKDRFQRSLAALGVDLGFFWASASTFEARAQELEATQPKWGSLLDLLRRYRSGFHNALAYYRNTYLEHRDAEVDPRMLASFHRLDAAEETFENVWRAIEGILAGVVTLHLPDGWALAEIPEGERDPARPERFTIVPPRSLLR